MDWIQDHLWETWLGLGIALAVAEMFSLDLVLIMLAGGAFVGMLTALLGLPVWATVLAAMGASVAMLALVRPKMAKRMHGGPELSLGHGKLVGVQAVVTHDITGLSSGRIKAGGEEWSALPYDDTLTISAGETVEILEIRGATAYVHPMPRLES